jgi:hypothetical protein
VNYVQQLEEQIETVITWARVNRVHNPLLAGLKIYPINEIKRRVTEEIYQSKDVIKKA